MTAQSKSGLIGLVVGIAAAWAVVYIIQRDKDKTPKQQPVTDESIRVAVESYQKAMQNNEPKENLDEINRQLLEEFGITVEYKSLLNKYYIKDKSGTKIKEV